MQLKWRLAMARLLKCPTTVRNALIQAFVILLIICAADACHAAGPTGSHSISVTVTGASARQEGADRGNWYTKDRKRIEAIRKLAFPHLGSDYQVLGPATGRYNCIAWSFGITDKCVWPGKSLELFDGLNARFGYKPADGLDYQCQRGVQKIVLYGKRVNGKFEVTHQARQMPDGTWTSKIGKMALIRHRTPDALDGPGYGHPVAVYYRRYNKSEMARPSTARSSGSKGQRLSGESRAKRFEGPRGRY
jgi:hypothetical protein